MGLTKVSYSMIAGAPANIMDYGASPLASASTNTAAIQQCIDENSVIYIPAGTYQINGPISINDAAVSGGQRTIYGDSKEKSIIQATTANSILKNNVHRHDAIVLQDFTFDGNDIAIAGVSLGVDGSVGVLAASSADNFINFRIARCVTNGLVLNYSQYFLIQNCEFSGTTNGFGLYLNECGSSEITNMLTASNKTAVFIGGTNGGTNPGGYSQSSFLSISNWRAYGPYTGLAQGYLYITNAHHIYFNDCSFEHEIQHTTPLVWIRKTSATVTSDIIFSECNWNGLAFNTDLIEIGYCRRSQFINCSAIIPNAGYYIIKSTGAGADSQAFINNCLADSTYSQYPTVYWKAGGYTTGSNVFEFDTFNTITDWTITLKGSTSDPTGVALTGSTTAKYYQIGNLVYFTHNLGTVTWSVAGTGIFSISGLPTNAKYRNCVISVQGTLLNNAVTGLLGGDDRLYFFPTASNTALTWADATSGNNFVISGAFLLQD